MLDAQFPLLMSVELSVLDKINHYFHFFRQLFALKAEELCVLKAKMDDLERQKHLKMKEKLLSSLEDRSKVSASNTEGALQPEPPPVPQTDGSKPQG